MSWSGGLISWYTFTQTDNVIFCRPYIYIYIYYIYVCVFTCVYVCMRDSKFLVLLIGYQSIKTAALVTNLNNTQIDDVPWLPIDVCIYIYIYIYTHIGIDKNVSFFRCSAAAKYFAAKILYPKLIFAAALLNFAAILLSTESDPNSCGPKADGPFRDPKGRSYLHLIYWTHRWRIDINITRWISPIEPS